MSAQDKAKNTMPEGHRHSQGIPRQSHRRRAPRTEDQADRAKGNLKNAGEKVKDAARK